MKYILGLTFLLFSIFTFAQNDEERTMPKVDEDFMKYLDDGKRMDADADIKIAVTSLVSGFLAVEYEHKLSELLSVQGGGQYQLFGGADLIDFGTLNDNSNFDNGFGYTGALKLYKHRTAITSMGYSSVVYRNRTTNYSDVSVARNDVFLSFGAKYLFMNVLSADMSLGGGVRMYDVDYSGTSWRNDYEEIVPMFNLEIKLGYYINY